MTQPGALCPEFDRHYLVVRGKKGRPKRGHWQDLRIYATLSAAQSDPPGQRLRKTLTKILSKRERPEISAATVTRIDPTVVAAGFAKLFFHRCPAIKTDGRNAH